jgi:hypothetical protein
MRTNATQGLFELHVHGDDLLFMCWADQPTQLLFLPNVTGPAPGATMPRTVSCRQIRAASQLNIPAVGASAQPRSYSYPALMMQSFVSAAIRMDRQNQVPANVIDELLYFCEDWLPNKSPHISSAFMCSSPLNISSINSGIELFTGQ